LYRRATFAALEAKRFPPRRRRAEGALPTGLCNTTLRLDPTVAQMSLLGSVALGLAEACRTRGCPAVGASEAGGEFGEGVADSVVWR
jgi:hypothetical protein